MSVRTKKRALALVAFAAAFLYLGASLGAAYFTDRRVKIRDFLTVGTNVPVSSDTKVTIEPGLAANKGLVIVGMSAQSDNLQEWQNSSNTVLAKVASDGDFTCVDLTVTGSTTCTGITEFDTPVVFNDGTTFGAEIVQSGGTVTLGGATTCSTTLAVTGKATHTGELEANGTLDSNSDATFAARVAIAGSLVLSTKGSDPCADTGEFPAGTVYFNGSSLLCFCDSANNDMKVMGSSVGGTAACVY